MMISDDLLITLKKTKKLIGFQGELSAEERKKLFDLIEIFSNKEHSNAGYLRRSRLSLICALYVLSKLDLYPEMRGQANQIILKAEQALLSKYDLSILEKDNSKFHTAVIDLFEYGEKSYQSVYAGMSSFSATNTVLYDINFDLLGCDEKIMPPDDWDAGFYASLAISGSAIWEDKGGRDERKSFWEWYLDYAIPLAWNVEKSIHPAL